MRRAVAAALGLSALAHGVCSIIALHALWREAAGLNPISTYAGLPFLLLGFPWIFLATLLPGNWAAFIGTGAATALNFLLLSVAAFRTWVASPRGQATSTSS